MAIETYEEQLERVQGAIRAIESGEQSYSVGGMSLTRADLKTLYDREAYLMGKVGEERYGTRTLARWPGR